MFAGSTDDALRVLVHLVPFALLERVLVLRLDVTAADRNCIQLVRTDAAIEEFLAARIRVERPLRAAFHERNREGPVLAADEKKGAPPVLLVHRHAVLLAGRHREFLGSLPILCRLVGKNDVLACSTEQLL